LFITFLVALVVYIFRVESWVVSLAPMTQLCGIVSIQSIIHTAPLQPLECGRLAYLICSWLHIVIPGTTGGHCQSSGNNISHELWKKRSDEADYMKSVCIWCGRSTQKRSISTLQPKIFSLSNSKPPTI